MDAGRVLGRKPNAGLDAGRHALAREYKGDCDCRPCGGALDPAPTELRYRNVEALFEPELVEIELERSILVGYGDADRPNVRDGGLSFLVHFVLLLICRFLRKAAGLATAYAMLFIAPALPS